MAKTGTTITAEEARRAIYIDFEGNKDASPVLLGVAYAVNKRPGAAEKLVLEHHLVDEQFWSFDAAVPVHCENILTTYSSSAGRLEHALRAVLLRAEAQDRLIVSWSTHDQRKVAEARLDGTTRESFERRYRNAIPTARRWLREEDTARLPKWNTNGGANKLTHYLNETGYSVPGEFGVGKTGATLRALRLSLESGKRWDDLTETQKSRWQNVLGHNLHDCVGMRHVVRHAVAAGATSA